MTVRNWGPAKGVEVWVQMNYAKIDTVAVGVGYLPANTSSNVTVSGLQALIYVLLRFTQFLKQIPAVDPAVNMSR